MAFGTGLIDFWSDRWVLDSPSVEVCDVVNPSLLFVAGSVRLFQFIPSTFGHFDFPVAS